MADLWLGLDLGSLVDYSAASVVRRTLATDPETGWPERSHLGNLMYRYEVLALRRYPLGTAYAAVVKHVVAQLRRPELGRSPRLVIDATGVGAAVVEMFRDALKGLPHVECWAVSITAGKGWSAVGPRALHCAEIELVGAIRSALESGRLKIPAALEHAELLRREFADFRVKITAANNETFSAREGEHDDMVLCVCLAIWLSGLRMMEMHPDPEWLLPREQALVSGELQALEREEVEAAEAERSGRLRAREERQAARHADITDDHWWPDSPGWQPTAAEDEP
jgi:hypothetical protein